MTEIRPVPTKRITYSVNVFNEVDYGTSPYNDNKKELEIFYPEEFVRSTNRKFVNVISVRCVQLVKRFNNAVYVGEQDPDSPDDPDQKIYHWMTDYEIDQTRGAIYCTKWVEHLPDIYTLHCSFVHDTYNDDNTVAWLNEPLTTPRRFEQFKNERSFKLWVVDNTYENPEGSIEGKYRRRVSLTRMGRKDELLSPVPFTSEEESHKTKTYYVFVVQMELEF